MRVLLSTHFSKRRVYVYVCVYVHVHVCVCVFFFFSFAVQARHCVRSSASALVGLKHATIACTDRLFKSFPKVTAELLEDFE